MALHGNIKNFTTEVKNKKGSNQTCTFLPLVNISYNSPSLGWGAGHGGCTVLVKKKKRSTHLQWAKHQLSEFYLLYVRITTTRFAEHRHRDEILGEKLADLMCKSYNKVK